MPPPFVRQKRRRDAHQSETRLTLTADRQHHPFASARRSSNLRTDIFVFSSSFIITLFPRRLMSTQSSAGRFSQPLLTS